jgi:molecular chaperone HtpG
VLDNHFVNTLEHKFENSSFVRVDADTIDKLIKISDDENISKLDDKQKELLKPIFEKAVDKSKFTIVFDNLSETDMPVMITQPEFMRRMKDMSALGGGYSGLDAFPDRYNLVVNSNHNLVYKMANEENDESREKMAQQLTDLALLSQNLLKGEELTKFIKRSVEIL